MNAQSCDRCRHRKSRCDRVAPTCGPCSKAEAVCRYIDRTKDRRETIERLQRRMKALEAANADLTARLAQSTPDIPGGTQVDESGLGDPSDPGPVGPMSLEGGQDGSRRSDEVIEEVSFLSRQAGGEHHFLGSASGIPFARLVSTTIGATSPGRSQGAFEGTRAPSQTNIPSGLPVETSVLPPHQVACDLHRAYFDHDHLSYPFLHRSTVLTALDRAYKDPSFLEQDACSSFVFDMVLAIATANVHKFDLESLPNAEGYYLRAAQRLDEVLRNGGIQALQAILLMGQYCMTNSTQDTSNSMWHIVGIAARMCFELGLHREQMYKYPGASNADSESIQTMNGIRRRCFWCVVAMDRVVSIALGRPLAIHLQDADVALPDLSLDALNHCATDTDELSASRFSRTAIFVHIVRYRVICGDILSTIHNGSGRLHMGETPAHAARSKLALELATWHQDTGKLSLPAVDLSSAIAAGRSSYCTREWHELLYHNALLMLYRPSPALSLDSSRDAGVLQTIFVAAKRAIALYAHLHRSGRINYTWITLHSVFMAGLSYLYAISRHFRSRRRHNFPSSSPIFLESDPTIIEIVTDSRGCSNVLVAISERWNLAKNCHDVFNRLSDAMLSDVVEHHTKASESVDNPILGSPQDSRSTQAGEASNIPLHGWAMDESGLAIDSMLHECFLDLQRFQPYGYGNDPVSQFSHDWLGEIGETGLNMHSGW